VHYRYASIKAKDLVRAWLAHVIGHAAGHSFTTIIFGKKKEIFVLNPLADGTTNAQNLLDGLLRLYQSGLTAALPFAPESSKAYAEAAPAIQTEQSRAGTSGSQTLPTDEEALDKAMQEWDAWGSPEKADAYLFAVWGDDGPMMHPGFGTSARSFWTPLLLSKQTIGNACSAGIGGGLS
jgi:exonuclease V gamma subunit